MVMNMTNLDVSAPHDPSDNDGQDEDDGETSPTAPSVASSQEWDKVTDPGVQTPAT